MRRLAQPTCNQVDTMITQDAFTIGVNLIYNITKNERSECQADQGDQ